MKQSNTSTTKKAWMMKRLLLAALFVFLAAWNSSLGAGEMKTALAQSPTPTPDRLAEPELSENPTQYEQGQYLYWMHCMPCHGDVGQGLTEEFIDLWPEDHQNCWGRGCHGGRIEDEGFPLPDTIPAIDSSSGDLAKFQSSEEIFDYLHITHPPQHPGYLSEDEYWAITAYVLTENNRLSPGERIGPNAGMTTTEKILLAAGSGAVLIIVGTIIVWINKRRKALTSLEYKT
jgi:hypothetical protein